jgi:SlyX protein
MVGENCRVAICLIQLQRAAGSTPRALDFRRPRGQSYFMADEHSRRTEKLESHVAHLEHQVEQLNGVVIEQGKLLERLKKEVQRQSRAMESLVLERIQSNNQKPPHY